MLSLGVSVMALAQPAAAVLRGNNILRAQLVISMFAAVVAVGGMALLVPLMGVRGAAVALLAAELTSLCACVWVAQQWLREQGMHWPWKAFNAAAAAVPVTALGMVALELLPAGLTLAGLAVVLALQGLVAILYWRQLPALARARAASLLARFMPASRRTRVAAVAPPAANGSSPKP
jgi:Na+-driven multidrug efflux pump